MPDMRQLWNRRDMLALSLVTLAAGGCSSRRPEQVRYTPAPVTPRPTPAPAQPLIAQPSGMWYVVEGGDTLSSISRRSGANVDAIRRANHLSSNLIKPGQRLWLPDADALESDPLASQVAAVGITGSFNLVSRSGWTKTRVGSNHRKMGRVSRITLHHTGHHKGFIGKTDREIVGMIDRYHRRERKWSAIGYHYIIGRNGDVYEGRPAHIQGAHVSSNNSNNLGISVIGDFRRQLPATRQLGAVASFLDDRRRHYGLAKSRIYGHRDLGSSVCPGEKLHGWLTNWKRS